MNVPEYSLCDVVTEKRAHARRPKSPAACTSATCLFLAAVCLAALTRCSPSADSVMSRDPNAEPRSRPMTSQPGCHLLADGQVLMVTCVVGQGTRVENLYFNLSI